MADPRRSRNPDGFALLAALWICVGIAALSWLITASARDAVGPSRNRVAEVRAAWTAGACLAQIQSTVSGQLTEQNRAQVRDSNAWNLARRIADIPTPSGFPCEVQTLPLGTRFDVNALDASALANVLVVAGLPTARAESSAAAIMDWRDGDDVPRPGGAERAWYFSQHRPAPSNRAFVSQKELHLVRGLESVPELDSLLEVEPGPVALSVASPMVLAALPGFSRATAAVVDSLRRANGSVPSLQSISQVLPPPLRATFDSAQARLGSTIVFNPTTWVLRVASSNGTPRVTRVLEVRVALTAMGLAIGERKTWLQ